MGRRGRNDRVRGKKADYWEGLREILTMGSNAYFLARAGNSSTLARVTEVLDTFAARDRDGETLTAVRHYPAPGAQWGEFSGWGHAGLRAAYNAQGNPPPYTPPAAAGEAVPAGKNLVIGTPTASGETTS